MRAASLSCVRTVSLDGLKAQWKIVKPSDTVDVDGDTFVRVACSNFSLGSLIASGNANVPPNADIRALLSSSSGLASLIAMRNQKQSDALSPSSEGGQLVRECPKETTHCQASPRA